MSSKLRNIFLNKKFYFSIGLLIVVAIITVLSINLFRINKLERAALTDFSDKILPYLDDIDYENEDYKADDISKYITFAMEYNFGENNKTEGSYDELNGGRIKKSDRAGTQIRQKLYRDISKIRIRNTI